MGKAYFEDCVGGDFENDLDNDPCEPTVPRVPGKHCRQRNATSSTTGTDEEYNWFR